MACKCNELCKNCNFWDNGNTRRDGRWEWAKCSSWANPVNGKVRITKGAFNLLSDGTEVETRGDSACDRFATRV